MALPGGLRAEHSKGCDMMDIMVKDLMMMKGWKKNIQRTYHFLDFWGPKGSFLHDGFLWMSHSFTSTRVSRTVDFFLGLNYGNKFV